MATVSHQTTTEEVHDGSTGDKVDEKTIHQIGVTVDGVFVPFLSKEDGWVQSRVAAGKAAAETEKGK